MRRCGVTFSVLLGRAPGSPAADRRVAQSLALLLAVLVAVSGAHAPSAAQAGGLSALCGPAALVSATVSNETAASDGDAVEGPTFCAHCLCGVSLTFKPLSGDGVPLSMAAADAGQRGQGASALAPEQRHRLARSPPSARSSACLGRQRAVAFL